MSQQDQLRALVPGFALVVAVVAAGTDPVSEPVDLLLAAVPVAAFALWAYLPRVPLAALVVAVLVPVVLAQHDGDLEPLLFEGCLLAFVVGRWAPSLAPAIVLGLAVMVSPIAASLVHPSEIGVGTWTLGMVFPWIVGRAMAHQRELALQLDATRGELAQQALLAERRQIARDVHDSVGHGVAALMLQVTSARHVLTATRPPPRRRCARPRRSAGAPCRSCGARSRSCAATTSPGSPHRRPRRPTSPSSSIRPGPAASTWSSRRRATSTASNRASAWPCPGSPRRPWATPPATRRAPARGLVSTWPTARPRSWPRRPARPSAGPRRATAVVGMRERATALGGQFAAGPTSEGWRVSCQLPLEGAR